MGKTSLTRARLAELIAAYSEVQARGKLAQLAELPRLIALLLALLGAIVDELESLKGKTHE